MPGPRPEWTSRRCRGVVPLVSVIGAVLGVASAAWACLPGPQFPPEDDLKTLIQSCAAPAASPSACRSMVDAPPFPAATAVKGPAGSRVMAYVTAGLSPGLYDLVFADKAKVARGDLCHQAPLTVLAGPVATNPDRGINPTLGVIPAGAQLGGGQLCFAGRATGASLPARFKVII